MRLIDEQPMETFPVCDRMVYVRMGANVVGYKEGEIERVFPHHARQYDLLPAYTAWSYEAETTPTNQGKQP